MTINKTRFVLPFALKNFTPRGKVDTVVLHFTAGSTATGAFESFKSRIDHVHTPYIVDKDGTIYELYDPASAWGWALGLKLPMEDRTAVEKRCIHVEIVNEGPLRIRDGKAWWWPPKPGTTRPDYQTEYKGEVFTSPEPFRGDSFWAAFPEPQFQAVVELTKMLCQRFEIPYLIPSKAERERVHAADELPNGICTHQQFRADKVDIGPAWPWERM